MAPSPLSLQLTRLVVSPPLAQVGAPLPVSTWPDDQIARLIQQGDTSALAALVERHHSPLLGYLYRLMGGDRALAEDLTQETFLRALCRIQQYQPQRPFKPWLYAIATNLARDYYKQAEQRYTTALFDLDLETIPTLASDHPDELLGRATEAQHVLAALGALPPPQRETLILRYYQDLSLDDIAQTLHVPVGTVKSRLSLGLRRLKDLMKL